MLLDCANGATYQVAPEIFRRLGASVDRLRRRSPTGATSTPAAAPRTWSSSPSACCAGAHALGFAFDGDGDRVLAVDRHGEIVDGDELLALATLHLRARGPPQRQRRRRHGDDQLRLPRGDGARRRGGATTSVGDRYVLEELRARGWTLGGEQSGHIIEMGFNRTGDGIASALLDARGARRARPQRARRDGSSCPSASSTCAFATAGRSQRAPS